MTSTLLVFQFILTVILTITVLLQKSSSIGLGAYSGSNESVFGAKGPGGFLTKFTFFIGGLFVVNTIALGYLYNINSKESIAEKIVVTKSAIPSAPQAPQTSTTPTAEPKNVSIEVPKTEVKEVEEVKTESNTTQVEIEKTPTTETNTTQVEVQNEVNSTTTAPISEVDQNKSN